MTEASRFVKRPEYFLCCRVTTIEPTALADGSEATIDHSAKPEASAFAHNCVFRMNFLRQVNRFD